MRYIIFILTLFALISCEQDPEIIGVDVEKKEPKVDVCHYDADTDTWKTINISKNALQAHLKHGDFEGSCDRMTYVPDNDFEGYLICKGYDVDMDDYVLTKNIYKIEELNLPYDSGSNCGFFIEIPDLTGLEDFVSLKKLSTGTGIMTALDLSTLVNLENLTIQSGEFLENLDISQCLKLENLWIGNAHNPTGVLKSIDITKNVNLKHISLNSLSGFEEIDLSKSVNLESIDFYACKDIDVIDLSNSTNLTEIILTTINNITILDLKNTNNLNLTNVYLIDLNYVSTSLCIQVDNAANFAATWTDVDSYITFSEDCGY